MLRTLALTVAFAAIAATSAMAAGPIGVPLTAHGKMELVPGTDCFTFVDDEGVAFQPSGAPGWAYRAGMALTLTGNVDYGRIGCQGEPVVRVTGVVADGYTVLMGTVRFTEGCWVIETGRDRYEALSDDGAFYQDGARVRVDASTWTTKPVCGTNRVALVLAYSVITPGHYGVGVRTASCRARYALCTKLSRDGASSASCDQQLADCLSGE